jgi:acid phosphatase (class A)
MGCNMRIVWASIISIALLAPCAGVARERGGNYISNSAVDLRRIMGPPPSPASAAGRTDLEAVQAAQVARTSASIYQAQADQKRSLQVFSSALGHALSNRRFPLTGALVDNAIDDARGVMSQSKTIWQRDRPFRMDASIKPCVKEPGSDSYPSSHAASAQVISLILAEIIPELSSEIARRATEYSSGRVVCGVHFPSDIRAGKQAGDAIFAALKANRRFMTDLRAARSELRNGLGYAE